MKKIKLKNNLQLITVPMKGTNTATVLIMVHTGSKNENKNNNGISHFLEHMFFKGTKKRPNTTAISSELDSIGAEFNAFTSKEFTGYWVKVDKNKINLAIDIVSDMLLNSKFDADEIEKEKGVIIEEINMYYDNPMIHIEDIFEECLYGDTPAGWNIAGPKKNILKFKRKDFTDYFDTQYSANNMTICIAGNLNKLNIKQQEKKYFTKFKSTKFVEKAKLVEKQTSPQIKVQYKKTDQAHISLGVRSIPIDHKDEFALKMLGIMLGGSMSSRLFIEVREKQGLAYYVRTSAEFYTDSGYLTTQAGTSIDKVTKTIEIILHEYKKITENLVTAKELNKTKDLIFGRSAIQLEASDNVASWYGRQGAIRKKMLSPKQFKENIKKVTPKDIQRIAKKIFVNDGLNLAVIGPFKNKNLFNKIIKL